MVSNDAFQIDDFILKAGVNLYSYIPTYLWRINQFHPSKQVKDISLIKMHCNKQHKFLHILAYLFIEFYSLQTVKLNQANN